MTCAKKAVSVRRNSWSKTIAGWGQTEDAGWEAILVSTVLSVHSGILTAGKMGGRLEMAFESTQCHLCLQTLGFFLLLAVT